MKFWVTGVIEMWITGAWQSPPFSVEDYSETCNSLATLVGNSQHAQLPWEIIPDSRKMYVLILVMGAYEMETDNTFKGDFFS